MKKIPLTRHKFALVDDREFEYVNRYKWHFHPARYAEGIALVGGKKREILMHRFILHAKPKQVVNHISGDGLDNRHSNIRLCSKSQNQRNRKMLKNNKSGFKGVSWHKSAKKWTVFIQYPKNTAKYLGLYSTKHEAAKVYNVAAKKYHGKFARLNII